MNIYKVRPYIGVTVHLGFYIYSEGTSVHEQIDVSVPIVL